MARDPRYDVLFEPVRIGPVTARNRFYQVPHCNGMGYLRPDALAAMRGVKAEGGWGVVCTEEVSIHQTCDYAPYAEGRLWSDADIPALALMADAVHEHGALAAIQPVHGGFDAANTASRLPPMAPSAMSPHSVMPMQVRAMDKADIRALRRWHRAAAVRAKTAGFDIVYVYAGHNITMPMHFISKRLNRRSDEYGGSLENRVRLLRELIEDTKDAVGDRCGVALRFAVDEMLGDKGITSEGEGREVVEMLAELPDLWDVNVADWPNDSMTSRFAPEGAQEKYVSFVKAVTTKPVVGVGRFTSPETMLAQIRGGVLDLIGSARPSIADPFLPQKIEQGRLDEIRECIGCNICVASDFMITPIRCTQNPTMGEEWRRGWHPERIEPKVSDDKVLVVGAGPAGLEAALALVNRGYAVTLAEATRELGGRVRRESQLPGLAEWIRVVDYRVALLDKALEASGGNLEIFRESRLTAGEIREFGAPHILIATGSSWRRDGVGRAAMDPIPGIESSQVYTPDDLMDDATPLPAPGSRMVVYDDDHYYMGGVLAEKLQLAGCEVTLVTPASEVSSWTEQTMEQVRIQTRLLNLGIELVTAHTLAEVGEKELQIACGYTDRRRTLPFDALTLVTARASDDALFEQLEQLAQLDPLRADPKPDSAFKTLRRIGDCLVPSTIAQAVWDGHRAAREFQSSEPVGDEAVVRQEHVRVEGRP